MQAGTGRKLALEGRNLFAAFARLTGVQPDAVCSRALPSVLARGFADDSLKKTALYDFNVDQGGATAYARSDHCQTRSKQAPSMAEIDSIFCT